MHDCPYERYIPIYLVVGGCFGIVKNLSMLRDRIRDNRENRDEGSARTSILEELLAMFLLAWFIAGLIN